MDDLCCRLEAAEERNVIIQITKEMIQNSTSSNTCWKYASFWLQNVPKLRKFLTVTEIEFTFSSLIVTDDQFGVVRLLDLCFEMNVTVDEIVVKIFELVCKKLGEILESTLRNSNTADVDYDFNSSLTIIISLKDRLCNYCTSVGNNKDIYGRLCRLYDHSVKAAVSSCLERAFLMVSSGSDVNLIKLSSFVGRGRNILLGNETLITFVVHWFRSRNTSPIWDRLAQRIFLDDTLGPKETASIVKAVMASASSHTDLIRCLGYSIRTSLAVKMICTFTIITMKSPNHVLDAVVGYMAVAGGPGMFQSFFEELMLEWSDKNTVKHMPDEHQKYLARCILLVAHHGRKHGFIQSYRDAIFPIMIKGVQQRLSNADVQIRQTGMFIGETLSSMMTDAEPLKFEYEQDEWMEEMQMILQGNISEPMSSLHCERLPSMETTLLETTDVLRKMQLDSDDEIDFPTYSVSENERIIDMKENESEEKNVCSRPMYIRDCLDRLDEKDKYEVFESAFLVIDSFIRRKGVGFDDIASVLIRKLVFLTNKFNTKDFESVRHSCIVSCLVVKPELCPDLIILAFARCCSMFHRYLILECVLTAAKELTSSVNSVSNTSKSSSPPKLSECDNVVEQRIKSNTRYFGKTKNPVNTYRSRFSPVAPLFFYPLLTTSTGDHLDLKGEDASFLSRVLFTAGDILACSSLSPSIVNMASTLTALVAPLRFHDESSVRAAAVFCFHAVCSTVPDMVLADRFGDSAQTWADWCVSVIDDVDESEKNQQLAKLLLSTILAKMKPKNIKY